MWSLTSFSNQPSVITGPPTPKREVTVLSCVFNNKETNTKKKKHKTSTQDVIQQFSETSILPCGLWRAEIQKSAQKTWEWNRKRILFALHLICSYKVHQQFRVMTESYTEEETLRTFGALQNEPSVSRGTQRWSTAASHKMKSFSFFTSLVSASGNWFWCEPAGTWRGAIMAWLHRCPQRARLKAPSVTSSQHNNQTRLHQISIQKKTMDGKKNMFRNTRNLKLHHKCGIYNAFKILSFY